MPRNLPKYVSEYVDRHGRIRRYFRYRGKNTAIPYKLGRATFNAFYKEMLFVHGIADERGKRIPDLTRKGFIYFARSGDLIKIGFSVSPEKRMRELQTGSANKIEIIHKIPMTTRTEERELHRKFAPIRAKGEWFYVTSELLNYIEEQKNEVRLHGKTERRIPKRLLWTTICQVDTARR